MQRKRLWAPAPESAPVSALAPDQSREMALAHDQIRERAPVPTSSPERAPAPAPGQRRASKPKVSSKEFWGGGGGGYRAEGRGPRPRPQRQLRHGPLSSLLRHGPLSSLLRHGSRNRYCPGGLPFSTSIAPTPAPRWMLCGVWTCLLGGRGNVSPVLLCCCVFLPMCSPWPSFSPVFHYAHIWLSSCSCSHCVSLVPGVSPHPLI